MRGDVQCWELSLVIVMRGDIMRGKGKRGSVTRGGTIAPKIHNKDEDYSLRANTLAYFDGALKVKEKSFIAFGT